MANITKAFQINQYSITDVFLQPCIKSVEKMSNGRFYFQTYWEKRAYIGDWLVLDGDGVWHVYTDEEYRCLTR